MSGPPRDLARFWLHDEAMSAVRTKGRVSAGVPARHCASVCAAYVLCALLAACGPVPSEPDASMPGDGALTTGATLVLELAGDVETLEDDVTLDALTLRTASLRARGDRGGDFDPRIDTPMSFDLSAGAQTRSLDAAPATYSSLALRLESAGAEPAFRMRVTELGQPSIELVDEGPIDLDLRCESPGALEPLGVITLRAALKLGELHGALRSSSLPAPVDGVIRVDATTAPEVVDSLRELLLEHWEVSCSDDG